MSTLSPSYIISPKIMQARTSSSSIVYSLCLLLELPCDKPGSTRLHTFSVSSTSSNPKLENGLEHQTKIALYINTICITRLTKSTGFSNCSLQIPRAPTIEGIGVSKTSRPWRDKHSRRHSNIVAILLGGYCSPPTGRWFQLSITEEHKMPNWQHNQRHPSCPSCRAIPHPIVQGGYPRIQRAASTNSSQIDTAMPIAITSTIAMPTVCVE
jgi:hypothetical protein